MQEFTSSLILSNLSLVKPGTAFFHQYVFLSPYEVNAAEEEHQNTFATGIESSYLKSLSYCVESSA